MTFLVQKPKPCKTAFVHPVSPSPTAGFGTKATSLRDSAGNFSRRACFLSSLCCVKSQHIGTAWLVLPAIPKTVFRDFRELMKQKDESYWKRVWPHPFGCWILAWEFKGFAGNCGYRWILEGSKGLFEQKRQTLEVKCNGSGWLQKDCGTLTFSLLNLP